MSLTIRSPQTAAEFEQRNELLQSTMRNAEDPFAIQDEYPLVLSEAHADASLCLFDGARILAHLNYWPRELRGPASAKPITVAFVGNVASHPNERGKGHIHTLFEEVKARAARQDVQALYLWSDLPKFYQKLGFTSAGAEFRFSFAPGSPGTQCTVGLVRPEKLTEEMLEHFLTIRQKTGLCVTRSAQEFIRLLKIPSTFFFTNNEANAYWILGKGADMAGVVHEWGAPSPEVLVRGLRDIAALGEFPDIMLLSPNDIPENFVTFLDAQCLHRTAHPMAHVQVLNKTDEGLRQKCESCFIWGLDSI